MLLISSCKKDIEPIKILRFEQDLFDPNTLNNPNHYKNLQKKYGPFYQVFAQDMLNISEEEQAYGFQPSMSKFVGFPAIKQLKFEVDSVFPQLTELETTLAKAMDIYKTEFPKTNIPCFVTFISEFGYAQVNVDTVVGIGLDMYLGSNYALYPALEFPDFMAQKLRKEYILPNTIKSIGIGQFESQLIDKRFMAMMLFEGKLRYFMKELLPQVHDSLIFGYSPIQLNWAQENEGMVWKHLIESKMLLSVNPSQYMRYFNDGPFTIATGVPQESAPAIGIYTGYKIICKYMENKQSASLKDLMLNANWDEILRDSNYRPK